MCEVSLPDDSAGEFGCLRFQDFQIFHQKDPEGGKLERYLLGFETNLLLGTAGRDSC